MQQIEHQNTKQKRSEDHLKSGTFTEYFALTKMAQNF